MRVNGYRAGRCQLLVCSSIAVSCTDAALLCGSIEGACTDTEGPNVQDMTGGLSPTSSTQGLLAVRSTVSAADAIEALEKALEKAGVAVALDLDHQASARSVDLALPPSRVFVFGNPALGTPLMQENALAGLDLPLKMLVSEDPAGAVIVTYDSPDYLHQRHALDTVDSQLEQAASALANFASAAAGRKVAAVPGDATGIEEREGVIVVESTRDPIATLAALTQAIDDNPALSVVAQIDHQASAARVGLTLGFATVVIFGSPNVGTPLMQGSASVGLDLPLRILVTEREGLVVVAYNSPLFMAERHGGLEGQEQRLQAMSAALGALSATAAGP